jgi:hypothetical protein
MLLRVMTSHSTLRLVTKGGSTPSTQKKKKSMELHQASPKEKARTIPLGSKDVGTVFWDVEGRILVDFLTKGKTMNEACYTQMLKNL